MRHQEKRGFAAARINHPPSSQLSRPSRRRLHFLISMAAGLLLAAPFSPARADDQIRAVRLSNVVGSVQILSGTETQFSQAYPNMPMMQGSTLKTGEDGRAEIQFEDGTDLAALAAQKISVTPLRLDLTDDDHRLRLEKAFAAR